VPENSLVIVSNRGAVTFSRSGSGERTHSRGAGGLVTALNAVSRQSGNAVWISSATSEEDSAVAKEPAPYEVEDLRISLVEHDPEAYDLMYNRIANPLLWFVHHGLYNLPFSPDFGEDTRGAWERGYLSVNENFAEAVAKMVEGDDSPTILLHDYQLYMTPKLVREKVGGDVFVSLFVHIPWPEPDSWRTLPDYIREGVLESLLHANVVAFHTKRYVRAFLSTVEEVLGADVDFEESIVHMGGREVWVRAYPISIDPSEFEELSRSDGVIEEEKVVRNLPGKLLLRVDRMDLSKNIVRGFRAYGRMLEKYPEMRGEVTFLAQLQPSRGGISEYDAYAKEIEKTVEEVNEAYGNSTWKPVELSMEDNFPRSVAAYKNYDALLVNAVRDGMNLVAKEAAVVNEKGGVLILSEGAGAYEELKDGAITVNPFDLDEQAEAIHEALTMPEEERHEKARILRETVHSNTIEDWVESQMKDIAAYRGR
jgi:trehalose 6-phosphate synthase